MENNSKSCNRCGSGHDSDLTPYAIGGMHNLVADHRRERIADIADEEFDIRMKGGLELSPCNFMAVDYMRRRLDLAGFIQLDPAAEWELKPGGKYYMVRNDTAIFAFIAGHNPTSETGFRIIAAHSDSPGFKLKPNAEIYGDGGVVSLNVEKYGGPLMYTWFDRPLSIAARLMLRGDNPLKPRTILVDLERPVALIPHLAIHFNRSVNDGNPLSVQKDMKPVVGYFNAEELAALKEQGGVVKSMLAEAAGVNAADILGMEAVLYPVDSTRDSVGLNFDYLMSPRLDDLSMAFCALEAIITAAEQSDKMYVYMPDPDTDATCVMAIFDNEETGSGTRQGAAAPTLRNLLERIHIALERQAHTEYFADERALDAAPEGATYYRYEPSGFYRALERTFLISADDAHAWHPNYNEKYDPTNHPVIGGGPVVKINANCKYMTDSRGDAIFRNLGERAGVECQYFVNHADVAGGSTLGNILTSQLDIAGVDMGCAIWAMHSACETGSMADLADTERVFEEFFAAR